MHKLNKKNPNTPEMAYGIFENRWKKELHYIDWERFKSLIKFYKGGERYLDIGCFNSPMPIVLKRDYPDAEICALDHCEKLIEELKKRHPEVNYIVGDAMRLPFEKEHFDYVVAGELIEHLENPKGFIKEAMRVIKKGGWLALSTPVEESKENPVADEHLWSFSARDLEELLKPYGEVKLGTYQDTVLSFMVYCQKI